MTTIIKKNFLCDLSLPNIFLKFEFKKKLMLEKSKVFRYFLLYDYETEKTYCWKID